MHGARSGAKPGVDHPNYRHGQRTKEAMALRAHVMDLVRESGEVLVRAVEGQLNSVPQNQFVDPALTPYLEEA